MAETDRGSKLSSHTRPNLTLPPRSSFESFLNGGSGFSPGPITMVSNFFSDSDSFSFSQLLAGAMASPAAIRPNCLVENLKDSGNEKSSGYKQNRPMNLVVAQSSPMFMVPSGLTPSAFLNSPGFLSPQSPFGMSHQQALAHVTAQAALSQSLMQNQPVPAESWTPSSTVVSDPESPQMESPEVSQSDRKPFTAPILVDKPVNDGYNWRKYGQKQVKASEYPRSYYKCTHLTCPVKKKVERSLNGQVSEITYKGQHNHELPQPNKHAKNRGDGGGNMNTRAKPELQGKTESSRPVEVISLGSDQVPAQLQLHGSMDRAEMNCAEARVDLEEEEPNPKRRNTEVGTSDYASSHKVVASEVAPSHKPVTESRIIVQTRSEVDLLDDGYKWRKYGQKVVKGNIHPRSYYKCTYVGCNVRKHVERAQADPQAVVTSYEGKHNHDVPSGRRPAPRKETSFAKDQRQVQLQLKEEQIAS